MEIPSLKHFTILLEYYKYLFYVVQRMLVSSILQEDIMKIFYITYLLKHAIKLFQTNNHS